MTKSNILPVVLEFQKMILNKLSSMKALKMKKLNFPPKTQINNFTKFAKIIPLQALMKKILKILILTTSYNVIRSMSLLYLYFRKLKIRL